MSDSPILFEKREDGIAVVSLVAAHVAEIGDLLEGEGGGGAKVGHWRAPSRASARGCPKHTEHRDVARGASRPRCSAVIGP